MLHHIRLIVCSLAGVLSALAGDVPGIKNFDQVDAHVYRGAQPTKEGFRYLTSIGVKTVIDLREAGYRANAERRIVREAGMAYINVPMARLTPPTEADLREILPVFENSNGGPIFVHCKRGADRTGAVVAAYHIDHDHWDNARALSDAMAHGMRFYQIARQNFIKNFRPRTIQTKSAGENGAPTTAPVATTSTDVKQPARPRP